MSGIYGYWDEKNNYAAYIGKDFYIEEDKRNKEHNKPSKYDDQAINRALQNNPERYTYFKLAEGNFSEKELNEMESQAIGIFKTFKYDYPERSVFNFTKGGEGIIGWKHSENTRKKMSEAHQGENNPNYGKTGYWYNKTFSEEHKMELSKAQNNTGYYRVNKHKCSSCKQGFRWRYQYRENGKQITISSVSIVKLEEKVKAKGLLWKKLEDKRDINDKKNHNKC